MISRTLVEENCGKQITGWTLPSVIDTQCIHASNCPRRMFAVCALTDPADADVEKCTRRARTADGRNQNRDRANGQRRAGCAPPCNDALGEFAEIARCSGGRCADRLYGRRGSGSRSARTAFVRLSVAHKGLPSNASASVSLFAGRVFLRTQLTVMIRIASVEVRAEPHVALHIIRSQSACLLDI